MCRGQAISCCILCRRLDRAVGQRRFERFGAPKAADRTKTGSWAIWDTVDGHPEAFRPSLNRHPGLPSRPLHLERMDMLPPVSVRLFIDGLAIGAAGGHTCWKHPCQFLCLPFQAALPLLFHSQ